MEKMERKEKMGKKEKMEKKEKIKRKAKKVKQKSEYDPQLNLIYIALLK